MSDLKSHLIEIAVCKLFKFDQYEAGNTYYVIKRCSS